MAILLPLQTFNIGPGIGKSYFEDLLGGTDATVTVNNLGAAPVDLVLYPVNSPVLTYTVPAGTSLTIGVGLLLVAGLLTGPAAGTVGTIQIATTDF
ncbi:hypothetical protein AWM70_06610 [Paenibacillus yonginensis]|uniref:Uncharacterized protein n=1 Tax=Paenibacillus yonginensis TaxID=1462996 RepID=A0A1B1MYR2_9BACL|nr:hypothetical protein [Paenibacillus yonginensis]ANS74296.1 hypothetical protein AWM70_06610 [Paenibacillus yonginensis]